MRELGSWRRPLAGDGAEAARSSTLLYGAPRAPIVHELVRAQSSALLCIGCEAFNLVYVACRWGRFGDGAVLLLGETDHQPLSFVCCLCALSPLSWSLLFCA